MSEPSKARIVFVLPRYDPDTGSHFFHLYELLASASRKVEIFLVIERASTPPRDLNFDFYPVRTPPTLTRLAEAPAKRVGGEDKNSRRESNAPVGRPRGPRSNGVYIQKFSFPPLRFLELVLVLGRKRLSGHKFFYTHYSFYGGLASWLVTRLFGGTAYYWNCGMPWLYRRPPFKEAIFGFILRHLVLVTGTKSIAEEYRRRYSLHAAKIRVVPNGINLERFSSGPTREKARRLLGLPAYLKVILFTHRLSRRKGAHLLPAIIAEVAKSDKNAMFVIVGDGPERQNLEARIKNQGLVENVRIAGEVPQRDLPPYFRAADVFLMPSEEEGFPRVLLEAMAAGIPYVASDVGGVKEITPLVLQDFLVSRGDIRVFAGKITDLLLKSPERLLTTADAEKEWVKQYDIPRVLPLFVALFR